jgi:flagellar hook-length control protein FliK
VAATTPTAAAPTQSPAPPVAGQLVPHVAVLGRSGDGTHSLTVVLRPDNLGPVQVQVTVSRGALDLTLRGAHEQGRAALMDALPELRRELQSAGLDCSRLDVSRDTGGSWTSQHSAAGDGRGQPPWARPGQPENRPRPFASDADAGRATPTTRSTTSPNGVDVLV